MRTSSHSVARREAAKHPRRASRRRERLVSEYAQQQLLPLAERHAVFFGAPHGVVDEAERDRERHRHEHHGPDLRNNGARNAEDRRLAWRVHVFSARARLHDARVNHLSGAARRRGVATGRACGPVHAPPITWTEFSSGGVPFLDFGGLFFGRILPIWVLQAETDKKRRIFLVTG